MWLIDQPYMKLGLGQNLQPLTSLLHFYLFLSTVSAKKTNVSECTENIGLKLFLKEHKSTFMHMQGRNCRGDQCDRGRILIFRCNNPISTRGSRFCLTSQRWHQKFPGGYISDRVLTERALGGTVPLSDWLKKKKVPAIIIKQQFGFPMSST